MTQDIPDTWQQQNALTREAWETNAAYWDQRMGDEGNDYFRQLHVPAYSELLPGLQDKRVLDAACGNGVLSRWLADRGASVVAFDFSAPLIELAKSRSAVYAERIRYEIADATDRGQLGGIEGPFDAITCNMGLMDIANIEPLIEAGRGLLRPTAPFVFSVSHPCFNNVFASIIAERLGENGRDVVRHSLRLTDYRGLGVGYGEAIRGQPLPQLYFDRTLADLLGAFFAHGYVMDGLREPLFTETTETSDRPTWGNLRGIPAALVCRMRAPG